MTPGYYIRGNLYGTKYKPREEQLVFDFMKDNHIKNIKQLYYKIPEKKNKLDKINNKNKQT